MRYHMLRRVSSVLSAVLVAIYIGVPCCVAEDLRVLEPLATIPASTEYRVSVSTQRDAGYVPAHVHYTESGTPDAVPQTGFDYQPALQGYRISYVNFEFRNVGVWVKVEMPDGDVPDFKARPVAKGVEVYYEQEDGRRIAKLKFPAPTTPYLASVNLSVIPVEGGVEDLSNVLNLFANPFITEPTGTKVIHVYSGQRAPGAGEIKKNGGYTVYFHKGVHDIGLDYVGQQGTSYYLENGAYVKGVFRNMRSYFGMKIYGHGIITGSHIKGYDGSPDKRLLHSPIRSYNCASNVYEGITIEDPANRFTIGCYPKYLKERPNVIKNVKFLSWRPNGSGLQAIVAARIEDCFIRSQSSCLTVGSRQFNTKIKRVVTWNDLGGSAFTFGWGVEGSGTVVSDCDVLYSRDPDASNHSAVFYQGILRDGKRVENIAFRDIRIEDASPSGPLFHIAIDNDDANAQGLVLRDIFFEDISAVSDGNAPNVLRGWSRDPAYMPQAVWFRNVTIGGKRLQSLEGWDTGNFDGREAKFSD